MLACTQQKYIACRNHNVCRMLRTISQPKKAMFQYRSLSSAAVHNLCLKTIHLSTRCRIPDSSGSATRHKDMQGLCVLVQQPSCGAWQLGTLPQKTRVATRHSHQRTEHVTEGCGHNRARLSQLSSSDRGNPVLNPG